MRTFALIGVVAFALAFSAACAPAPPPAASPAPPTAATTAAGPAAAPTAAAKAASPTAAPKAKIKRGGTLTTAEGGSPTLDPQVSNANTNASLNMMFDSMFSNVLKDPEDCRADAAKCEFEIRGALVEQADRVDPTTYTFKLRKNVKFHDGSTWDAETAKWNLERLGKYAKSIGKDLVEPIQSTEVVDSSTLRVKLKAPTAVLTILLNDAGGQGRNRIVSKAALDKLGDDEFGRRPAGTGPFKLKEWKPDQQIALERFDGYWGMGEDDKPLPYIDGVVVRYMPEEDLQAIELRSGNVEVMRRIPPAQSVPALKSDANIGYWEFPFAGARLDFIINAQDAKNPILSQNLKLRQAIGYSLNRDGVVRSLGLGYYGYAAYYVWPKGGLGYDDTLPKYDYQPDKAKQLLAESGYAGQEFEFLTYLTQGRKFAELMQQQLGAIGIKLLPSHVERLAWVDKTRGHNFDTAELQQGFSFEPVLQTRNFYVGALGNYEGHQNKEVDKCMDDGAATEDPKLRQAAYRRCEQIIYEMAYRIPVFIYPTQGVAWRKYVKGITSNGIEWEPKTVWIDK